MIAEGSVQIKSKSSGDSNFELIFSPLIWNDFPIMLAWIEADISNSSPKHISGLFEHHKSAVILKLEPLSTIGLIPFKARASGEMLWRLLIGNNRLNEYVFGARRLIVPEQLVHLLDVAACGSKWFEMYRIFSKMLHLSEQDFPNSASTDP